MANTKPKAVLTLSKQTCIADLNECALAYLPQSTSGVFLGFPPKYNIFSPMKGSQLDHIFSGSHSFYSVTTQFE